MVRMISSYIFFFFLTFTLLSIGVSEFSKSFSQLFYFLCKDGMVYSIFVKLLYGIIAFTALFYIIISHQSLAPKTQDFKKTHLSKTLVAAFIAVIFFFIWIFSLFSPEQDFFAQLRLQTHEIAYLDFWALLGHKFVPIIITAFFTLFFLYLPLIFWIIGAYFDLSYLTHRFAYTFFPSINVCIFTLFASALQPYYDKPNLYLYIDLFVFLLALVLLLWVFIKKKFLFGFYEYAHLLFLVFVLCFILLSSSVLADSDYFNARYSFYLFAFLVWCCEWMFEDFLARE